MLSFSSGLERCCCWSWHRAIEDCWLLAVVPSSGSQLVLASVRKLSSQLHLRGLHHLDQSSNLAPGGRGGEPVMDFCEHVAERDD